MYLFCTPWSLEKETVDITDKVLSYFDM
jgi:hypothetical protein